MFTTAQHALDRTRRLPYWQNTKLWKLKEVCVEKKTRWGRQETTLFPLLFHYKYFKIYIAFVFQEINWFQKFKTLEKNEKIQSQKSMPRSNQELTMKNNQK